MAGTNSIFITNNGLSDHIGVAQVLPYLEGLAARGHHITCISVEDRTVRDAYTDALDTRTNAALQQHHKLARLAPTWRKADRIFMPHRLSQVLARCVARSRPQVVHCRSYMPLAAALRAKRQYGIPVIFDMRGFWIDQRIEAGQWKPNNLVWRAVIDYFRRLERTAFGHADAIIVLTEDARSFVQLHDAYRGAPIEVIPCSVDMSRFAVDEHARRRQRSALGIEDNTLVLAFLGAASALYRMDVAYRLVRALKDRGRRPKLLLIGRHQADAHLSRAGALGVPLQAADLICRHTSHEAVSGLLNAADFGLSLLLQSFSSSGVSATKTAEYLACGLPVISNEGVGDVRRIIHDGKNGFVLADFSEQSVVQCARVMCEISFLSRERIRAAAAPLFNLERAVDQYDSIYRRFGLRSSG